MNTYAPETSEPALAVPEASAEGRNDRHLRTDHLMGDLKGRSVRGGALMMSAQAVKFVLQLGSTVVLARLLSPDDFGLVAMVTAITGFVAMFKDAGLSMATVQREEITHEQVSALFWVNVGLSTVLMLVVAGMAPAVAWFYGKPELTAITLALAGTFLLGGLTVQHQALLRRQLRMRALGIIDVVSKAAGVGTAVVLALLGFGYWALVWVFIAAAIANCVGVWVASGWRPSRPARAEGVRALLAFGGNLTATNFANYFFRNLDNIIVGKFAGAVALGFYSTAYRLLLLPINQINGPITGVMVPVLSRLQSDGPKYRAAYIRSVRAVACLTMPMVGFLFVAAEPMIVLALGEQWKGAVPIFVALGPAAYIATLNITAGWTFVSMGHTSRQLKAVVFHSIVACAGMLAGIPWGAVGVALGLSVALVLVRVPYMMIAYRGTPVGLRDLWRAIGPPTLAMLAAATACTYAEPVFPDAAPAIAAATLFLIFAPVYAVVLLLHREIRREAPMILQTLRLKPQPSIGEA